MLRKEVVISDKCAICLSLTEKGVLVYELWKYGDSEGNRVDINERIDYCMLSIPSYTAEVPYAIIEAWNNANIVYYEMNESEMVEIVIMYYNSIVKKLIANFAIACVAEVEK